MDPFFDSPVEVSVLQFDPETFWSNFDDFASKGVGSTIDVSNDFIVGSGCNANLVNAVCILVSVAVSWAAQNSVIAIDFQKFTLIVSFFVSPGAVIPMDKAVAFESAHRRVGQFKNVSICSTVNLS